MSSDDSVKKLLNCWVLNFSDGTGNNPGGFCRAIKNSPKLRRILLEKQVAKMADVDESLNRVCHFGFAPQRFNTICDACTNILENIEAVCDCLGHLVSEDPGLTSGF